MSTLRNGPVLHLTKEEIASMEPNKPTPPRRFGTDASLDWPEQLDTIRRASSKAVTRLLSMLDGADESSIAEIVRALAQSHAIVSKALAKDDPGQEPTDEQLMKRVPK
jgi:hypothetical protein